MGTWPKRIALALAIVLALSVLAYFVLEARGKERLRQARETFEREIGSLEPTTIPPAAEVPTEDDVIAVLREGARILEEVEARDDDWTHLREMVRVREPSQWSEDEVKRLEAVLEQTAPLVEVYRRAGSRTRAAYRPEDLVGDEFSLAALQGVRLLLAETGLALRRGDEARARGSLEALGRIVWALDQGPGLVHRLIGQAIEEYFLRGVRWMAERPDVSVDTLRSLRERLLRESAAEAFRRGMAKEAGLMFRTLQDLDEQHRLGGKPVADWYARLPGAVDLDTADMLDSYREFASLAEHPFLQARTVEAEALEGPQRPIPKVVLDLLFPNFYETIGKLQAVAAARQLARKALELRISALEGEDYPDELDDLEPDPLTGDQPVYEVTESGVRLENPVARDLWQEQWGEVTQGPPPPYSWSLPRVPR